MNKYCFSCGSKNDYHATNCLKCKNSFASAVVTKATQQVNALKSTQPHKYHEPYVDSSSNKRVVNGDDSITLSDLEQIIASLEPIKESEIYVEQDTFNLGVSMAQNSQNNQ